MTTTEEPITLPVEDDAPLEIENDGESGSTNHSGGDASVVNGGGKKKKREDKSYEFVLRSLGSLSTPEEKLAALCKKYSEIYEENKTFKEKTKQFTKKFTAMTREKEQLEGDKCKLVLAKDKLESLCRELQKQNKTIKEENLIRTKLEEERRTEMTTKFESSLQDIQVQMKDYAARDAKHRDENLSLAEKFRGFSEQVEKREEHMNKVIKTRELEVQLSEAKLQQSHFQREEEKQKAALDMAKISEELSIYKRRCEIMEETEKTLKQQIEFYKKKYEEFNSTVSQSNDVFTKCRSEMEKMGKRQKKLERDAVAWKDKCEASNKSLLAMIEEKSMHEKQTVALTNKMTKLEGLCRALQAERVILLKNKPGSTDADSTTPDAAHESADAPNTSPVSAPPSTNPQDPPTQPPSSTEPQEASEQPPPPATESLEASTQPPSSSVPQEAPGKTVEEISPTDVVTDTPTNVPTDVPTDNPNID